jgi:hypothetical protein
LGVRRQVAKALLDGAAKAPPRPQAPALGAGVSDAATLAGLLRFREDALTAEVPTLAPCCC